MKLFTNEHVGELVGLDNNSTKNDSQQNNFSIQATNFEWTETKYLPDLPVLPANLTFNFDNKHPSKQNYVRN